MKTHQNILKLLEDFQRNSVKGVWTFTDAELIRVVKEAQRQSTIVERRCQAQRLSDGCHCTSKLTKQFKLNLSGNLRTKSNKEPKWVKVWLCRKHQPNNVVE